MDCKAQISLEAMLVLGAVLLIAAWFISSLISTSSRAGSKVKTNSKKAFDSMVKKS